MVQSNAILTFERKENQAAPTTEGELGSHIAQASSVQTSIVIRTSKCICFAEIGSSALDLQPPCSKDTVVPRLTGVLSLVHILGQLLFG